MRQGNELKGSKLGEGLRTRERLKDSDTGSGARGSWALGCLELEGRGQSRFLELRSEGRAGTMARARCVHGSEWLRSGG